ncbi:MAG TPA: hypothetical protein VG269_07125 [Tepidisphaeraceae bacterium]|jgi:hypothetical protein|nr:hypothetical protein [Tepidisphaeraceae bacterium]
MNTSYLDRIELNKWPAISEMARSREILYLAMLTGYVPRSRRARGTRLYYCISTPDAARKRLADHLRSMAQMHQLNVLPILDCWATNRAQVLDRACDHLLEPDRSAFVIVLDPDTGLVDQVHGRGHERDPRYLTEHEVLRVWRALRPGDALIVYQHNQHFAGWREYYSALLAKLLNISNVSEIYLGQACLYFAEPSPVASQAHGIMHVPPARS